jgi:hypothetical protein
MSETLHKGRRRPDHPLIRSCDPGRRNSGAIHASCGPGAELGAMVIPTESVTRFSCRADCNRVAHVSRKPAPPILSRIQRRHLPKLLLAIAAEDWRRVEPENDRGDPSQQQEGVGDEEWLPQTKRDDPDRQ